MSHSALIILSLDCVWITLVFAAATWAFICIHRTHQDVMKVLTQLWHRPMTHGAIMKAYDAVSFHKHLRARFFCRDPWKLYDPIVRDAIENPRTEVIGGVMMGERPDEAEKPPTVN